MRNTLKAILKRKNESKFNGTAFWEKKNSYQSVKCKLKQIENNK